MENRASLLRDASMEASPSPGAAADLLMHAAGKGKAGAVAGEEQWREGSDGAFFVLEKGESDMQRRVQQQPRQPRSPWTAPRARKTRRRGGGESAAEQAPLGVAGAGGGGAGERERREARGDSQM